MKIKKLQHDLFVRLAAVVGMLSVALTGVYYLRTKVHQLEEKYNWYKSDTTSLTRKLETLNKRTIEFSDAVRTWESMTADQKLLQGLQLSKAKTLLEELQTKFKLSEMNVSFSKPEEVSDTPSISTPSSAGSKEGAKGAAASAAPISIANDNDGEMKIVTSDVSITFKALSDEFVYNFIYALEHEFPGYVHIKTLTVNKEGKINKEMIQRIADGESPAIVAATVDFMWQDLRYIPVDKIPAAPEVTPESAKGGV